MLYRTLAFFCVIILIPVFLIVSILIVLENGFPIFFIQKRVGMDYIYFNLYKFRTMKNNSPNVATHLLENPKKYLLKSGSMLRKLSLDELPNLINIVKGEMAFVGPRPALYNQYDLMQLRVDAGVSNLKPGLTGWAQINGRDEISIQEKVILEKEYLKRKSFSFDVKILFITLASFFLKKDGVSH